MPKAHAVLSASSSERWLNCPPSARLCEKYPDTQTAYTEEGTEAHTLCEYKLRKFLGTKHLKNPIPKLKYFTDQMDECSDGYVAFVSEQMEVMTIDGQPPIPQVEVKLDFSKWVPDGFGTGDCVLMNENTIHIIDFKYGQGVPVSAEWNPQMMLYAIGAYYQLGFIYDIQHVKMSIYQPRIYNESTFELDLTDLQKWADNTLIPTAKLAYEGKGEFKCGKWCQFCKAKNTCRKRAEAQLQTAREDFALPPQLTDDEINELIPKLDPIISWCNDIKNYALDRAIEGYHWTGYKLVEGRAVRKYTDEPKVAETVTAAGFDPYEQKIKGITAMTKELGGKKAFEEILGDLVYTPQGKPTLVPESDKRPEMKLNAPEEDFKEFAQVKKEEQ